MLELRVAELWCPSIQRSSVHNRFMSSARVPSCSQPRCRRASTIRASQTARRNFRGAPPRQRAIQTVQEQIKLRGSGGTDITTLTRGTFYAYTEGMKARARVATRLCLSAHPPSRPTSRRSSTRRAHSIGNGYDGALTASRPQRTRERECLRHRRARPRRRGGMPAPRRLSKRSIRRVFQAKRSPN
jgi:hypothetical protein